MCVCVCVCVILLSISQKDAAMEWNRMLLLAIGVYLFLWIQLLPMWMELGKDLYST